MATNAQQILVPANSVVSLAVPGSTAPVDATAALAAAWKDVGLTTSDSLQFSTEPTFEEVQSMQSAFPTRRFQTAESGTVSVDLQQWNTDNLKAVHGGGEVTEISTGNFKFTPPQFGQRSEIACIIDVTDGTKKYRFVFPRTQQVEGSEIGFNKSGNSNLALRLSILGGDSVDAWYMLTNDPAFDPTP